MLGRNLAGSGDFIMKVGDLVKNRNAGHENGYIGLVMEEEIYKGLPGHWIWYTEDDENWRWYSFSERYDVEVISESR